MSMPELTDRLDDLDRIAAPDLWPEITKREPRPATTTSGRRRASVALIAVIVAATGLAIAVRSFSPTPKTQVIHVGPVGPKSNGKIAFLAGKQPGGVLGGDSHIYVMNPDGTGVRQVTSGDLLDLDPVWSPDGARIAFVRTGGEFGPDDIYVVNADGSGLRLLSHSDQHQNGPSWSPDGKRIVFARREGVANYNLFVMNADGTQVEQLTRGAGNELAPAWSPDGTKIAYVGSPTANSGLTEIVVMNADGTGARGLPIGTVYPSEVTWSPDGSTVLYAASRADQGDDLYAIGVDGRGRRLILRCRDVPLCADLHGTTWSPDGKLIVLGIAAQTARTFHQDVYVMNADGTGLTKLTSGPLSSCCPSWQAIVRSSATPSPESSSIASPASFIVTCSRPGVAAHPAPASQRISKEEAIERACEEEGRGLTATGIDASLGWYQALPGSKRVRVWRVIYHGTFLPIIGGPRMQPSPAFLVGDYGVVIDAHTGAFLVAGS
jgi:Tol biopolymer transport system component